MSGMTRSMPSISSSGNMSPASTTMMSSPCSSASMFFPISPTPPSGMTRSASVTEQRRLHGWLLLRRGLRGSGLQIERERGHVGDERAAQRGLMERRGGVVHRENGQAASFGRPSHFPVNSGNGLIWKELVHRMSAERDDDARLEDLEVSAQPYV